MLSKLVTKQFDYKAIYVLLFAENFQQTDVPVPAQSQYS